MVFFDVKMQRSSEEEISRETQQIQSKFTSVGDRDVIWGHR
jgi:hypothetical protein